MNDELQPLPQIYIPEDFPPITELGAGRRLKLALVRMIPLYLPGVLEKIPLLLRGQVSTYVASFLEKVDISDEQAVSLLESLDAQMGALWREVLEPGE